MKEYIITALSVGGHSNKIFSVGDTVTERDFDPNEIPKLIEGGYIKEKLPEKKADKK